MKKILIAILTVFLVASPVIAQSEQSETYKGRVEEVNIVDCESDMGEDYICYTYEVTILGTQEQVDTMVSMLEENEEPFKVGDKVYLSHMKGLDGNGTWSITGYARSSSILIWSLVFVLLIFLIGGVRSLGSILSLILSFGIIYFFIIPQIINTGRVVLIGYIGIFLILILGMYLSHGFKKTTTLALLSSLIGVAIVSVLSLLFLEIFNINGMGEETAFLLSSQMEGSINVKMLFYTSILIGAVGVLDDVTIGQIASMNEIYQANRKLNAKELYKRTMNVGKEHIASMINTLFIVYAGSSLPLVLLMYLSNRDMGTLVSIDMVSEEIIRTLAISISLLLVVPIATYMGSLLMVGNKESKTV
jgi:uncharacterized membrane protein